MFSTNIRQATGPDMPYLYDICLKTGLAGLDATEMFHDPLMLGQYYAAPYLWKQPSLCFVALNDQGFPAGYIVGTDNTAAFNEWLTSYWLPPLRKEYGPSYISKSDQEQSLVDTIRKGPGIGAWEHVGYPAHLHIDILPSLQGRGMGKALMNTWLQAAAKLQIPGVHLGVDGRNTNAFGFYERMGFQELEKTPWGAIFGRTITELHA